MGLPFLSVTETSIWMRFVEILTTWLSSGVGVGCGICAALCPKLIEQTRRTRPGNISSFFIWAILPDRARRCLLSYNVCGWRQRTYSGANRAMRPASNALVLLYAS